MTRSGFPYTRMPGRLSGFVRNSSLWEGADHLLLVRGTRYSEEYRRFYYRDIQAVVVQKCVRFGSLGWLILSWGAFGIATLIAFVAAPLQRSIAGPIAAILAVVLLARLIVALRMSCRCFIQTAVSREELPCLHRRSTTAKALARLRIRIGEAQGAIADESNVLMAADADAIDADVTRAQDPVPKSGNPKLSTKLAILLFILMLLDAVQTFIYIDGPKPSLGSPWMRAFSALEVLAMGAAAVGALLSANGFHSLRSLRKLLIGALIFQGADITVSRFLGSLYQMNKGVVTINLTALRSWQWVTTIDGVVCVLLACGGLLFVLLNWENLRRGDLSAA